MKKIKKLTKVELHWIDSLGDDGWKSEAAFFDKDEEKYIEHRSCGYWLGETKRTVMLVQSYRVDKNKEGEYIVDHFLQIPKAVISKIVILKEA